ATPNTGFVFANYSGDLTGSTNPQNLTVNAPKNITANFSALTGITVTTNPPNLTFTVNGTTYNSAQTLNFAPGTMVTIAAPTVQGSGTRYRFASWSDGGPQSHVVTVGSSAATYTANFTPEYLLQTTVSPAAGGSITVTPSSPTNDGYYPLNATAMIAATPATGFAFSGFSGDLTGNTPSQSITLNGPKSVTANFSALTGVTVTNNPAGLTFSINGTNYTGSQTLNLAPGTVITLNAPTLQGTGTRYRFQNWSDGGTQSHTVTVGASAITITANFTTEYLLTVAPSPAAGGTVSVSPASPTSDGYYPSGTTTTVTATANQGYSFSNYSGDLSGSTNPATLTMNSPKNVTANFSALTGITITTNPAGLNFTVNGNTYSTAQTLNVAPGTMVAIGAPGIQGLGTRYRFANWSDGGPQSHTITAGSTAATYTANFTTEYLLTTSVSPTGGGSIVGSQPSPTADGYYPAGTTVNLTGTPGPGFAFANFSGDLSGSTATQPLTLNSVKNVVANFNALSGILVTTNPPGLTFTVNGTSYNASQTFNVPPGTALTLGATSPQGSSGTSYVFANWSDGGMQSHTITAGSGPATFTANFTTQYQLTETVNGTGTGTVTPASGGFYPSNSMVTLTATPGACSIFAGFSGNAPGGTVTFVAPQLVTATFNDGTPVVISRLAAADQPSSGPVKIQVTGNRRVVGTNRWRRTYLLTNTGSTVTNLTLALDNPVMNVVNLFNADGLTSCAAPAGNPYIKVPDLAAGGSVTVTLDVTTADPDAVWDGALRLMTGLLP
ncbi:MAG: hypothetical protein M3Z36_08225, partial [Acidobacteriota bacterium]|nr:hypothetical protein [Acidobacteriota bacterium]